MPCPICEKRKPKRFCPAKGAKICSRCCGAEREVTIDCPFECPYLQDSRERDYTGNLDPGNFPYKEIRVDDRFLHEHADLLVTLGRSTLDGTLEVQGAVDQDARQALDGLIKTYKTLESGIHYDSRPQSPYAARIFERIREDIRDFQQEETQETGFARTKDSDILTVLVFLYRMALDRDNHRPRGKAFLDFLRSYFAATKETEEPLIVPGV